MAGIIQQQMQPVPGVPGGGANPIPPNANQAAPQVADQGAPQGGSPNDGGGAPQVADQGAPQGGQLDFAPQSVRANMKVPPQLQEPYERTVAAGMKVMFSPQMHGQLQQLVQQQGDWGTKLGTAIAGLMLLLFNESNKTLPPQVIVPAGIELISHAVDFLSKAGVQVSPQDIAHATTIMIQLLAKKFGIDPNKLQAGIAQKAQGGAPAPADNAAPDDQDNPDEEAQEGEPPGAPDDDEAEEEQAGPIAANMKRGA